MRCWNLLSSAGYKPDLASPSPRKVDCPVPNTLHTGCSSFPQFIANVAKEVLTYIDNTLHLCCNGTFESYVDVLPFLYAAMMPWGHQYGLLLHEYDVLFLPQTVWLFSYVTLLNAFGSTRTIGVARSRDEV